MVVFLYGLTDGHVPVWTSYISANCTNDTTDISENTHELDMEFISQSIKLQSPHCEKSTN